MEKTINKENKEENNQKTYTLYNLLNHGRIAVNILFIILCFLFYYKLTPAFWDFTLIFGFAVLINVLFLMFKIKQIPEDKRENSGLVYWMSHIFILTLVVIALNQFLKRDYITNFLPELTIFAIATGFLTFYANKNRFETELEQEKETEEKKEKRRKDEFDNKFSKLRIFNIPYGFNKVLQGKDSLLMKAIKILILAIASPFIFLMRVPYSLTKWCYKEGWSFSIPFVIITIIFIAIKIGMPIVYTGSYIDEYYHIWSGLEFFKTGHFAEFYQNSYYNRGAYVSFLVGLFMWLFGKTIFVAKMVPALIGLINFFLLYFLSKRLITKKPYILLLMVIYTISPWVIFNHFYIRMFVFYELLILLTLLIFLKLIESIKNKDYSKTTIFFSSLVIINCLNLLLSNDIGEYMILFESLVFLAYIFLFLGNEILGRGGSILFKILNLKRNYKLIILILLSLIILTNKTFLNSVIIYLTGTIDYQTPDNLKYSFYFFGINAPYSIFFFLSLSILLIKNIPNEIKLINFVFILLLLVHLVSNKEVQTFRAVLYLLSVFYLVSISFLKNINVNFNLLIKGLIILIFLISMIPNYPDNFLNDPSIPKEVHYKDYFLASKFVKDHYKDRIVISSLPYVTMFYDGDYQQIYMLRDSPNSKYDLRQEYFDPITNITKTTLTKEVVLKSQEQFNDLVNNPQGSIIIILDIDLMSWATPETQKIIASRFKVVNSFERIKVYELIKEQSLSSQNT